MQGLTKKQICDKLTDRFIDALLKQNHRLNNVLRNQDFEHAASIRDEIQESIKVTAALLASTIGESTDKVEATLQKADNEIRKELSKTE